MNKGTFVERHGTVYVHICTYVHVLQVSTSYIYKVHTADWYAAQCLDYTYTVVALHVPDP